MGFFLTSMEFLFVILPSFLKVFIIALAVETLILNSLAAFFIVQPVDVTLSMNPNLYLNEIFAYFKPNLPKIN